MSPMQPPVDTKVRQRIRGPWVEVDLSTLAENIHAVRVALGNDTQIMFVVKANAYGHGMVPVATCAARQGVGWFAVAHLQEAVRLREAVEHARIVVLGAVEPTATGQLLDYRIIPAIVDESHGLALAAEARARKQVLPVHIKIDTGMARLGVWWQEAPAALDRLCREPGLAVEGLCSHFAAVEPGQPEAGRVQFERFMAIAKSRPENLFLHLSSSRAFLCHREWDLSAIRPGVALFGYGAADAGMRTHTKPVLQWKTTVTHVKRVPAGTPVGYYGTHTTKKETELATISLGYADGYLRSLSNRADVLIRGRRRRVVGRVSMNWITVDVGLGEGVEPGDEVVLIGRQGGAAIWADELAKLCRTIPYEILTMINPATERRYLP